MHEMKVYGIEFRSDRPILRHLILNVLKQKTGLSCPKEAAISLKLKGIFVIEV